MTWGTVTQLVALQAITFLALVLVLRRIMYASSVAETRRLQALSKENTQKAQELSRKIDEAEELYRERLAQAQEETRKLRRQAQEEVRGEREQARAKALEEGRRIVDEAFNTREKIRDEIRGEMRTETIAMALRLLERVLLERHRQVLHDCFFEELLDQLEGQDMAALLSGNGAVSVETSFPLSEPQAERLRMKLGVPGGGIPQVDFVPAPDCQAGLRLRSGGMVLDASLAGALEAQARELEEG